MVSIQMFHQCVMEKQITSGVVSPTTDMRIQLTRYTSDDMYQVQTTVYNDGGAVQINEDCYETPPLPNETREGCYGYNVSIPASIDTVDLNHFVEQSSRSTQERPGVSRLADVDEIREEHGDNLKTESDGSENMNMSMINMFAPESRQRLSGIITASHGLTDFDKIRNEVRQRYEKDEDTDDSESESNGSNSSAKSVSSDGNSSRRKSKESQRLALERERNSVELALKDYGFKVSALIDTECDVSLNSGSDSETDSDSGHSAFDGLEPDPKAARPLSDAKNVLKSKSATLSKKARARRGSLIRSQSAGQWTNEELATEHQEMVSQMASLAMHHNNSSERP